MCNTEHTHTALDAVHPARSPACVSLETVNIRLCSLPLNLLCILLLCNINSMIICHFSTKSIVFVLKSVIHVPGCHMSILLSSHPLFSSHCLFCSSDCLNLILTPPPAAQNANANADFANFDAFGSTSGSTGGFPSAPQAPFQPSNTGSASSLCWTNSTHPNHSHKTLACLCTHT